MKSWSLAAIAFVLFVMVAVAQPATPPVDLPEPPGPPDRIESDRADRSAPVWVAADRAVDARKQSVALDLLAPLERQLLVAEINSNRERRRLGLIGRQGDPCYGAAGISAEYYVMHPEIDDLVRHSEVAFRGSVRNGGFGLYRGQPRTLYRVSVEEVFVDDGHIAPGDTVYVAFQEAEIPVGEDWLCMRGPRYPAHPLPGKEILVFSHSEPWGQQPIFDPMDVELFFEAKDSISVPDHLVEKLDSSRWSDLISEVEAATAESGGEL